MWDRIVSWFNSIRERRQFIDGFNESAKGAFFQGAVDTLMKARISQGNSYYTHSFTKFAAGGFRIKVETGRALEKNELLTIGKAILDNQSLVRQMIYMGWDTLEIYNANIDGGYQWELMKYSGMGGFLGTNPTVL